MTRQFTAAELAVAGKACCGCVYHAEQGIPCKHDLAKLASARRWAKRSIEPFPIERDMIERLHESIDSMTYREAIEYARQNIANAQRIDRGLERVSALRAEIERTGGMAAYFRRVYGET